MPHFKHVLLGNLACLIAFVWTGTIAKPLGLSSQAPQSVSRLTKIVEEVAQGLGYRSMSGIRTPDQWAEGERQGWLVDHAYLTLFDKNSNDSCLGIKGRIGATILSFKDRETIERQLAKLKENHAGNMSQMRG